MNNFELLKRMTFGLIPNKNVASGVKKIEGVDEKLATSMLIDHVRYWINPETHHLELRPIETGIQSR